MEARDLIAQARNKTWEEMKMAAAKAEEYGSVDLKIMGAAMIMFLDPDTRGEIDDEITHGQLMAVAFYQLGKVARVWSALIEGKQPGPDTQRDIRVYSQMFDVIQKEGEWRVEPDQVKG